ncbi:MAG: phosphoribosylaminoimidazolesuccinocarboxamide synthase [Bacteroidota bacterium]|nr:phosphoribosylaminoimidazolesuccinocarboxamide synthase [Bacteroidota bacterium]
MTKSKGRELIYQGTTKNLYTADQPNLLVMEFISESHDIKKLRGKTKSLVNLRAEISSYLFAYLEKYQIPTDFVRTLTDSELLIKQNKPIQTTVHVYNYATTSLSKRFDLKEGDPLTFPILEYCYFNKDKSKTAINETHILSLGMVSIEDFKAINRLATKTNAVLRSLCERRNLVLTDVELEFGHIEDKIVLSGELSPLTCRFWNISEDGKYQRDYFNHSNENIYKVFSELNDRLSHKV